MESRAVVSFSFLTWHLHENNFQQQKDWKKTLPSSQIDEVSGAILRSWFRSQRVGWRHFMVSSKSYLATGHRWGKKLGMQPGASFQDMFLVWDGSVSTLRLGGRCDDSRTQEMGGQKSTKIIKGYTVKGICHFTYYLSGNQQIPLQFGIFESMILFFLQPGGICHPFPWVFWNTHSFHAICFCL